MRIDEQWEEQNRNPTGSCRNKRMWYLNKEECQTQGEDGLIIKSVCRDNWLPAWKDKVTSLLHITCPNNYAGSNHLNPLVNKSENKRGEHTPSRPGVQLSEQLYFFLRPCHGTTKHDCKLLASDTMCRLYFSGEENLLAQRWEPPVFHKTVQGRPRCFSFHFQEKNLNSRLAFQSLKFYSCKIFLNI